MWNVSIMIVQASPSQMSSVTCATDREKWRDWQYPELQKSLVLLSYTQDTRIHQVVDDRSANTPLFLSDSQL